MILYGSPMSAYVRKVLFCASLKGIRVDLRGARESAEEFAQVSPFRQMPAMRNGDFSISDSSAIIAYLEGEGISLIPTDREARARAVWFDEYADTLLIPCINKIFWQRFVNPVLMGQDGDVELAGKLEREELAPLLTYLETVTPEKGFLLGGQVTIGDIAVVAGLQSYIGYCTDAFAEGAYPRIARWLQRFVQHPSIAAVLEREEEAKGDRLRRAA